MSQPTLPPLWRNHDYNLLWIGRGLNVFGSQLSTVAYPLLVLALTHSPVRAGLVGTIEAIASIVGGIVGGPWVDRINRRTVAVGCLALQCLTMAALGALIATHVADITEILVSAGITGLLGVPAGIAMSVASTRTIAPGQMEEAMMLTQVRMVAAGIGGTGLGGVLFGIARAVPFVGDGVSYLAAAVCMLGVRTRLAVDRSAHEDESYLGSLAFGVHWLKGHPTVVAAAAALAFVVFSYVGIDILVIVLARRAGATSSEVGFALAMSVVGGAIGAALSPLGISVLGRLRVVLVALWAIPVLMTVMCFVHGFLTLGITYAAIEVFSPVITVVMFAKFNIAVPDAVRGRVLSLLNLLLSSLGAMAPAVAGLLVAAVGRGAPALMAVPGIGSALLISCVPALRRFVAADPEDLRES